MGDHFAQLQAAIDAAEANLRSIRTPSGKFWWALGPHHPRQPIPLTQGSRRRWPELAAAFDALRQARRILADARQAYGPANAALDAPTHGYPGAHSFYRPVTWSQLDPSHRIVSDMHAVGGPDLFTPYYPQRRRRVRARRN